MKTKKSIKASLENKRLLFFELGMIITLAAALVAFEWSGEERYEIYDGSSDERGWEEPPAPHSPDVVKPPPPGVIIDLTIVPDTKVIIDPVELLPVDAKPDDFFSYVPVNRPEKVSDSIYDFVEIMPKFRGKEYNEFIYFVYEHIEYPSLAAQNGVFGTVFVKFVIDEKGNLTDARIYKGVDPSLDKEVLRVINMSEKWTPGIQNFRPVKVSFIFPVRFNMIKS